MIELGYQYYQYRERITGHCPDQYDYPISVSKHRRYLSNYQGDDLPAI